MIQAFPYYWNRTCRSQLDLIIRLSKQLYLALVIELGPMVLLLNLGHLSLLIFCSLTLPPYVCPCYYRSTAKYFPKQEDLRNNWLVVDTSLVTGQAISTIANYNTA